MFTVRTEGASLQKTASCLQTVDETVEKRADNQTEKENDY
jgi:hypothetical protein